ncbi:MAG: hypothetical protein CALGDGBN_00697 [Pseudomonadales bacterium]|nr:hypothetical protein [Pseudomonadales bacterium]
MRTTLKRSIAAIALRTPAAVLTPLLGRFCPIFMLHRVHEGNGTHGQSLAHVERCLALLRRHRFRPLALPELARRLAADEPLPPKSVAFTIDDGFADHAEIAGPLFARHDVPLTCFVITGFLDGTLWPWDDQIAHALTQSPLPGFTLPLPADGATWQVDLASEGARATAITALRERLKTGSQDRLYDWLPALYAAAAVEAPERAPEAYRPMRWEDARRFVAAGHTIAPHTVSHRILSRLGDAESRVEITQSVARVHAMTGEAPRVFAYPTGRAADFTARDRGFAAAAGIDCAVSTEPRTMVAGDHVLALPRFSLPDSVEDFVQYLSFVELLKERLRR